MAHGGVRDDDNQQERLDLSQRGGAGLFRGADYQVRVAVVLALDLIQRQIQAPHVDLGITIEPAVVLERKTERWDIRVSDPETLIEAKVAPTAKDLRDFLQKAADSGSERCRLTYGHAAFSTFNELIRLRDASGSKKSFERYRYGLTPDARQLLDLLGSDPYEALGRIEMTNLPEGSAIEGVALTTARQLVGDHARDLLSMLTDRFMADAAKRARHSAADLIEEARRRKMRIGDRPITSDLSDEARAMLLVLQKVAAPIPAAALAGAAGVREADVDEVLADLASPGVVHNTDGLWSIAPLPAETVVASPETVLSAALSALLAWIPEHRADDRVAAAVDAAVTLSRLVEKSAPEVVALTFPVLDKLLKDRGDRNLVFEVADRSIRMAIETEPTSEVASAVAVALICGRSWVLQRVGRLDRAEADAFDSLRISEDLNDPVGQAFCHKCIGRLQRLRAEESSGNGERDDLLRASAEHLREAIERFANLGEPAEVGDAYSLLARTHLSDGDTVSCEAAVREASILLTDPTHKDYLDLQIVTGDLAAANGDERAAREYFDVVIHALDGPGSDSNEIRARALHQRGLLLGDGTDRSPDDDLLEAATIFKHLGDYARAAQSTIVVIQRQGLLPTRAGDPQIARLLEDEAPLVQVLAVESHQEAMAKKRFEPAVAYRGEATIAHWRQLVSEARKRTAQLNRVW